MKLGYVLLYAFIVTPSAYAGEIYKCVGPHGWDLYQNFPCQFDSIGWVPTDAQAQRKARDTGNTNAQQGKAVSPDARAVPNPSSERNVPERGMTPDEVKAIWGEPTGDPIHGLVAKEIVDGGIEIWTYGTSRTVQFDSKGRVSLVRH